MRKEGLIKSLQEMKIKAQGKISTVIQIVEDCIKNGDSDIIKLNDDQFNNLMCITMQLHFNSISMLSNLTDEQIKYIDSLDGIRTYYRYNIKHKDGLTPNVTFVSYDYFDYGCKLCIKHTIDTLTKLLLAGYEFEYNDIHKQFVNNIR